MKSLASPFLSVLFAIVALAHNHGGISIASPAHNAKVSAGANITVQIHNHRSRESFREIAIVIAFQPCPSATCLAPSTAVGTLLFIHHPGSVLLGPQPEPPGFNFTVTIPSSVRGIAQLSVTHFLLVGTGPVPSLQSRDVMLRVV